MSGDQVSTLASLNRSGNADRQTVLRGIETNQSCRQTLPYILKPSTNLSRPAIHLPSAFPYICPCYLPRWPPVQPHSLDALPTRPGATKAEIKPSHPSHPLYHIFISNPHHPIVPCHPPIIPSSHETHPPSHHPMPSTNHPMPSTQVTLATDYSLPLTSWGQNNQNTYPYLIKGEPITCLI